MYFLYNNKEFLKTMKMFLETLKRGGNAFPISIHVNYTKWSFPLRYPLNV